MIDPTSVSDETKAKFEQIEQMRDQGFAVKEACLRHNLPLPSYYVIRKALGREVSRPRTGRKMSNRMRRLRAVDPQAPAAPRAPTKPQSKTVCLIGTPEEIADILRNMKS